MADSKREAALESLANVVKAACAPAEGKRNAPEPAKIPADGLVNVLDGDGGEPETLLGPVTLYSFEHEAEIMIYVQGADDNARSKALDALLQKIGAALQADETLGGAVDAAIPLSPETEDRHIEGAQTVKAARVLVILEFESTSPLG